MPAWLADLEEGEEFHGFVDKDGFVTLLRVRTGEHSISLGERNSGELKDDTLVDAVEAMNLVLEAFSPFQLQRFCAEGLKETHMYCAFSPDGAPYIPTEDAWRWRFGRGELEGHYLKFVVERVPPSSAD